MKKANATINYFKRVFFSPTPKSEYRYIFIFILMLFGSDFLLAQSITLLKDINQGVNSSNPNFKYFNSHSWIGFADDGIHGSELWLTDGTDSGTVMIMDINPGYQGSSNSNNSISIINGKAYFAANDGIHGLELWVSDGTYFGTFMLRDIYVGLSNGMQYSSFQVNWVNNGKIYFRADDGYHGTEIWCTDGTISGTSMLLDINPGINSSVVGVLNDSLSVFQGELYFEADDGTHGIEIWKTDGSSSGTLLMKDLVPGPSNALGPWDLNIAYRQNGRFCFVAINDTYPSSQYDQALYISDGTDTGTIKLAEFDNINKLLLGENSIEMNGLLIFDCYTNYGYEIWRSDGTIAGTYKIDINNGPMGSISDGIFRNSFIKNGFVYFIANDGIHGNEVWQTDGTITGTHLVYDINPGSGSCDCTEFHPLNNSFLFGANDSLHGKELWITDGTSSGTTFLKDIYSGTLDGFRDITDAKINNVVLFYAEDPIHGMELWKTDGTSVGTELLLELTPGPLSSSYYINSFLEFNNILYFIDSDTNFGEELYRTDGSVTGTFLFNDFNIGPSNSRFDFEIFQDSSANDRMPLIINNELYFNATALSSNDLELWKTNGTQSGTMLVQDLNIGPNGSYPIAFNINGNYVFKATTSITGNELWRFDTAYTTGVLIHNVVENEFIVFPNPCVTNSKITFQFHHAENIDYLVKIYDSNGRFVTKKDISGTNQYSMSTLGMEPGIYTIQICNNNGKLLTSRLVMLK